MKKALIAIIVTLRTILIVVAVVSLIFAIGLKGNDSMALRMGVTFIASFLLCALCAIIEDMLKNQIDRQIASLERELQKKNDRIFCDVKPCKDGWECRVN